MSFIRRIVLYSVKYRTKTEFLFLFFSFFILIIKSLRLRNSQFDRRKGALSVSLTSCKQIQFYQIQLHKKQKEKNRKKDLILKHKSNLADQGQHS